MQPRLRARDTALPSRSTQPLQAKRLPWGFSKMTFPKAAPAALALSFSLLSASLDFFLLCSQVEKPLQNTGSQGHFCLAHQGTLILANTVWLSGGRCCFFPTQFP